MWVYLGTFFTVFLLYRAPVSARKQRSWMLKRFRRVMSLSGVQLKNLGVNRDTLSVFVSGDILVDSRPGSRAVPTCAEELAIKDLPDSASNNWSGIGRVERREWVPQLCNDDRQVPYNPKVGP